MDIFMDKLAQKINAQEIIKANTTAEIQELNALRSRVAEYNECLERLQKLIDENAAGIKGVSGEAAAEMKRLVDESIARIKAIQQDASGLEKLGEQLGSVGGQVGKLGEQLGSVSGQVGKLGEQLGSVSGQVDKLGEGLANVGSQVDKLGEGLGSVGAQVDKLSGQLGSVSTQLGEAKGEIADKLEQLSVRLEEKSEEDIGDGLEEKFSAAEENVHKECVKVYRNVQAVVMEESGKQGEALAEMSGKVNAMKGKLGFVLGISVVALVFSLAGAVLQLLDLLGIGLL